MYNNYGSYQPGTQFSIFPPAIKHLIVINGLCFVAINTPVVGNFLLQFGALWPFSTGLFYPWQLVSYMFLHGSFTHILFNLFALWMFGQAIENLWGTKKFVFYYFATGIGAGILQLILSMTSNIVIGASGAVFGILLAFGMTFPNREIMLLIPPIPIKAKYFVIIYGALELFSGISGTSTGIAHFAHLGGMIVGFVIIKYWQSKGENQSFDY